MSFSRHLVRPATASAFRFTSPFIRPHQIQSLSTFASPALSAKFSPIQFKSNFDARFARALSTSSDNAAPTTTAVSDPPAEKTSEQIHSEFFPHLPEIIKREEYLAIRRKLELDSREQITTEEYLRICKEVGCTEEEALELLKSFSQSGVVFNMSTSKDPLIADTVFLKPQRITNLIHAAFNVNKLFTGVKTVEEYGKLKAEFEALSKIKKELDAKAHASANRWIMAAGLYMILQAAVLARLTWWEFSWDIMEPITYFISFSTGIVAWVYFALQKQEYTYENLRDGIATKRRAKLYKKNDFDLERYLLLKEIFKN